MFRKKEKNLSVVERQIEENFDAKYYDALTIVIIPFALVMLASVIVSAVIFL